MTWEIFLGIVALVGFFISVATPIIKLTSSITKLNDSIQVLKEAMDKIDSSNEKSHKRLWDHNDEQDRILEEHKEKIAKIETKISIYHGSDHE